MVRRRVAMQWTIRWTLSGDSVVDGNIFLYYTADKHDHCIFA